MKTTLFLKKYRFVLISTCLLLGITVFVALNQIRWGLQGDYYANTGWQGEPVISRLDKRLWLQDGIGAQRVGNEQFSVLWHGWIAIKHAGTYRFGMRSDDDSSLAINGEINVCGSIAAIFLALERLRCSG